MAKYTADAKYICSIYPGELPVQRRNYGTSPSNDGKDVSRCTTFVLKPVPRGQKPPYFVLPIYDSFESIIDVLGTTQRQKGEKAYLPRMVPVDEIVADMLKQWTGGLFGVPDGAHPGIMEIAGPTPSKAEQQEMERAQTSYFNFRFSEGERLYRENKWDNITDEMRLAAEWLGHKTVWSSTDIAENSEPCPFCTTVVPKLAIICPTCRKQIREVPADRPDLAKLAKLQAA